MFFQRLKTPGLGQNSDVLACFFVTAVPTAHLLYRL